MMTCRIIGCCHGAGGSENRLPQAILVRFPFSRKRRKTTEEEEEMEERKEITMMMMMDDAALPVNDNQTFFPSFEFSQSKALVPVNTKNDIRRIYLISI